MKVVCCKKCGAKYQLDDDDDISAFECSSCAGDLEVIEDYSNDDDSSKSTILTSQKYVNSYIVQCDDCGLKYRINKNDNILDYECDSCGGALRYLDENLNKEVDNYLKDRKEEAHYEETRSYDVDNEDTSTSMHSVTDKIENFFSENEMQKIADEEMETKVKQKPVLRTARTTIPQAVLSKFGREFAIPKSNDYNVLKKYLKDEFFKGMEKEYENVPTLTNQNKFFDKISDKLTLKETKQNITVTTNEETDEIKNIENTIQNYANSNTIIVGIGAVIFVLSIIEILTINTGFGIITLLIGIIGVCYGLYKTNDTKETETRTRIIREHLLTLPEEYYVFYNVEIPESSAGINHVVIGPSGIYALISQKYKTKNKLESENENLNLIDSTEDNEKIEEITSRRGRRFKYTTKQAKFSQDNKIKQKSLMLGENLINFLNENNIRHCFVEPLVGFINNEVVVINTPLTDEDLFIEELLHNIEYGPTKLNSETIDKCAVLLNKYSADCSSEF